jgi:hypothetical protein
MPELLEAVCNHDDCPDWLQDVIWNGFNNRMNGSGISAGYFRFALGETGVKANSDPEENFPQGSKGQASDKAAEYISELLNDPNLPEPIREAIADGLVDMFNSHIDQTECNEHQRSPEYIAKILRGYDLRQRTA